MPLGQAAGRRSCSFTAGADRVPGKNILNNSDFDAGTSAWTFYTDGSGSVQQVSPGYDDNQALSLVIAQGGTNVQLYQNGIPLEVGTKYRLSFAAYSSTGNGMDVELQQHGAPYANYGLNTHISLSTSWASYSRGVRSNCPESGFGRTTHVLACSVCLEWRSILH